VCRFAFGCLCGVLPLAWMGDLPPLAVAPVLALVGAGLLARRRLLPLAGACLGMALALAHAHATLHPALAPELEGEDLVITGRVVALPMAQGRRMRFRFDVASARHAGKPVAVPDRVRLNWYGEPPELVPGDRWRLRVRLERGRGFANPATFDYARWLLREGIGATGYVSAPETAERLATGGFGLDRVRYRLRAQLHAAVSEVRHDGILLALALGDRTRIPSDAWAVLRATGTTHLVAISGLHIGLVAAAGFFLAGWLWRAWPLAQRRAARPVFQAWVGLALAAVYAALAGFALPTVRALLMLTVGLATIVLRRRARPLDGFATALVAVLLVDPLAPLGASFWLSFGAVAAILIMLAGRLRPASRTQRWLRLQVGIAVALTPLLTGFFGQSSLIAPLANLIAIPWMSVAVVPPALAATALASVAPAAAQALLGLADACLQPLWQGLALTAQWPLAQWYAPRPPVWIVALALAGAALLLLPRGLPGRCAGALALVPLVAWTPARPPPGAVWLDVLDVGQGLAAVVRTHEHTLVYDTGARFSPGFDAGSAVVVPFVRAHGIERLDGVVLSHLDNDHVGGFAAVREAFQPRRVFTSAPHELGGEARFCARDAGWSWDGVRFRFLHPERDDALRGNDASCVLRIDAPGGSLLLPGDIERTGEARLLQRDAPLSADVVVAPHHGSDTSSTPAFVRAVDPDWVLYAVGYRNQWDFPKPAVVARWRPAGWAATHCGGALALRIHPERGVTRPRAYRQAVERFYRPGQRGCEGADKSGNMRAVVPPAPAADSGG